MSLVFKLAIILIALGLCLFPALRLIKDLKLTALFSTRYFKGIIGTVQYRRVIVDILTVLTCLSATTFIIPLMALFGLEQD